MNREPSGGVATRRTKIVATLGPATGTDERIAALVDAGVNVVRVNASHGTAEVRGQWIAAVRRIAESRGVPIAVLVDLQGPRIRVGALKAPRELVRGQEVVFAPEAVARKDEEFGALAKSKFWPVLPPDPAQRVWTDDYSNVLGALIRRSRQRNE